MNEATDAVELLAEILSKASPHDANRNRSNEGRWVTINAPRELVERARKMIGLTFPHSERFDATQCPSCHHTFYTDRDHPPGYDGVTTHPEFGAMEAVYFRRGAAGPEDSIIVKAGTATQHVRAELITRIAPIPKVKD